MQTTVIRFPIHPNSPKSGQAQAASYWLATRARSMRTQHRPLANQRILPVVACILVWALGLVSTLDAQVKKPPIPPRGTPSVPQRPQQAAVMDGISGPAFARVSGSVFDSLAWEPLGGAVVQFVSADDPNRIRSGEADSLGRYEIDSVPVGTYLVGLTHGRLDQLGLGWHVKPVNVSHGGDVVLPLGLPAAESYRLERCVDQGSEATVGVFVGVVRSARHEALGGPARVRTQFTETTVDAGGIDRRRPLRVTTASAEGQFAVCGLPPGTVITTRAYAGTDSSGVVDLRVPSNGVLVRDIYVGSAERVTAEVGGSVSTLLRGAGMIQGIVRDTAGRPLPGARLSMPGNGAEGATTGSGQFRLDSLPSGTWMLEARAVGFEPYRVAVDVVGDAVSMPDIAMAAITPTVDTVRVQADKFTRQMAGFEQRRKLGFGHFYDDYALEQRNARTVADFLRTTPGLTVSPTETTRDRVLMRGVTGSGQCVPSLFLDGVNTQISDGIIDNVVNQSDVRAIEVYNGASSTPLEFRSNNGCGSIVIWTGGRRSSTDRR